MNIKFQNYEQIKQRYGELSIVNYYLPGTTLNKFFKSPLRKDRHASAIIYIGKRGDLMYNDFIYNGDIIQLVAWLYNETYREGLKRIIRDFSGTFSSKPTQTIKKQKDFKKQANIPTIITPYFREWRQYDYNYWTVDGGIPLKWLESSEVNVFPFIKAKINSKNGEHFIKADKLAYCYQYHIYNKIVRYKLYQPNSKRLKWISNIVSGEQGVLQLINTLSKSNDNPLLIISSSLKDSATIQCNTALDQWIPSTAPNNEGDYLPPQIVPKLNQRFKRILTWFDQDTGGHRAARMYKQKYNYDGIFIPEHITRKYDVKDPYAFRKKFGEREFIKLTKYLVNE